MQILAIVAHPDDEVLGAGGTLARHARDGDDVGVLFLSSGVMSRYEERTAVAEKEIEERTDNAHKACDALGIEVIDILGYPDNQFDTVPLLDVVQSIESYVNELQPEVIYTHHYGDLNIDHELTCRATLTAARPLTDVSVQRVLAFEVLSSSEWAAPSPENSFQPTVFTDISGTLSAKTNAMCEYEGELETDTHPRSVPAIEQNAHLWGSKCGTEAAEAFELLRETI